MYDINIRIKEPSGAEHSIEIKPIPQKTENDKSLNIHVTAVDGDSVQRLLMSNKKALVEAIGEAKQTGVSLQPIKIGADGSHMPAHATTHVAVLDPRTGLMWAVESLGGSKGVKQKDTAAQLKGFALLGHTDWRVPEVSELQTLVNFNAVNPAIDADLFPGTKSDWYWTNTAYAGSPAGYAWYVSFNFGNSDCGYRDDGDGFVRAVRSVPPSGQ